MHRSPIDDATADRLLTGQLSPDDAPADVAALAALIQVASGPVSPSELVREAPVVASMVAASTATQPTTSPRRQTMLSKLTTAKIAGLAAVGVLGIGTAAAAATGSLPGQTSHASSNAASGLATASSHDSVPDTATSSTTEVTTAPGATVATPAATSNSIPPTGPANVHAQFGLCTAFLAGNSTTSGSSTTLPPQDSSTAFRALIGQNGGVAATVTYCKGIVSAGAPTGTGSATSSGAPAGSGKPVGSGRPAGTGGSEHQVPANVPGTGGTPSGGSTNSGARPTSSGTGRGR